MILIESFKSTLSEVVESDLLLHVVDTSNQNLDEQMNVVNETLEEIGAGGKMIVKVFNKVDLVKDKEFLRELKKEHKDSVFISAGKGLNLDLLLERIKKELNSANTERILRLKPGDHKNVSMIYSLAEVREVKYLKNSIKVTFSTNDKNFSRLKSLQE